MKPPVWLPIYYDGRRGPLAIFELSLPAAAGAGRLAQIAGKRYETFRR
jgi:hypothetical protein